MCVYSGKYFWIDAFFFKRLCEILSYFQKNFYLFSYELNQWVTLCILQPRVVDERARLVKKFMKIGIVTSSSSFFFLTYILLILEN